MRRRLRIIAGSARSAVIKGPPAGVRPTTERVREVLFSSLGERIGDAAFVDLFAGSGAVGLEALSRGANRALFVDRRRACVEIIRYNLDKLGFAESAKVVQANAYSYVPGIAEWIAGEMATIFADPPYADTRWPLIVRRLLSEDTLPAGTSIIVECSRRSALAMADLDLPAPDWERKIGETKLLRWEKQ